MQVELFKFVICHQQLKKNIHMNNSPIPVVTISGMVTLSSMATATLGTTVEYNQRY